MLFRDAFEYIASRQTDELVVTSAGYASRMWRDITGDTERVFYVEASMSLSTNSADGLIARWLGNAELVDRGLTPAPPPPSRAPGPARRSLFRASP